MKTKSKLTLVIVVAITILSITSATNNAEACRPGEIYAEGNRFLGICWGHSSNECAKCIDVQQ